MPNCKTASLTPIFDLREGLELKPVNCTILLVEDNDMVRDIVKELLLSHGFRVLEAEGPKQALEMARGQELSLLLTDVVMPDMSGPELYSRLAEEFPGLKALYMSGYTSDAIFDHGLDNFIQKPFSANDLARKIETSLKLQIPATG